MSRSNFRKLLLYLFFASIANVILLRRAVRDREYGRSGTNPAKAKIHPALKYHIADVAGASSEGQAFELPVLWNIPESGGASTMKALSHCLKLRVASHVGAALEASGGPSDGLRIVASGTARYVNVDVSTPDGIARAKDLNLIGSGLADAVISPLLVKPVNELFSPVPGSRARVFTVFRHPVERAASIFYHLQSSTWEPTHDPSLSNMTIEEYAKSSMAENNWMVWMLNDEPSTVDERHLEIAKEVLRQKVVIGLKSDIQESARRFCTYFGWKKDDEDWIPCETSLLCEEGVNVKTHKKVVEGTHAWRLLASRNSLDVQLYEYAVELFQKQGHVIFGPNSFQQSSGMGEGSSSSSGQGKGSNGSSRMVKGNIKDQRRKHQLVNYSGVEGYAGVGEIQSNVTWSGIETAEWCQAPAEPPLPYEECQWDTWVFKFGVHGGLTNALHFILKGAIWAFEEGVCFFVDERWGSPARLAQRKPPEKTVFPFLERYFEPIGLPRDSIMVKKATNQHKFVSPSYHQIQNHEFGKRYVGLTNFDNPIRHKIRSLEVLGLWDMENIRLKKHMLRRMFRILPKLRTIACSRLSAHGLQDEYIAMSVRRGDKALEFELELSLQPYIAKAEIAIKTHFGGVAPKIFVASDDCSVMQELRELRPRWMFLGECDNATEDNGFVIADVISWTLEQTDRHYEKFITEMIAMALAKYWVGVSTTNVSFWIYYMRHYDAGDDTFVFVDTDQAVH